MKRSPLARPAGILAIIIGLILLILLVRAIFASALADVWAGDLHSKLFADYSADPDHGRIAPLDPAIIAEVIHDTGEVDGASFTLNPTHIAAYLKTPVPSATSAPGDSSQTPKPRPDGSTSAPSPSPPPSPTATPVTPTASPTTSPTASLTATPSLSPSPQPTATPTSTEVPPPTSTSLPPPPPSSTPTSTPTPTSSPTPTSTPTPTAAAPDLTRSKKKVTLEDGRDGQSMEAFPNTPVTYTIYISNTGSAMATDVIVYDTLPTTFTLNNSSIYGPSGGSFSGSVIEWGPFDVAPHSHATMGFSGALDYASDPPQGQRGEWVINRAEINAPWLAAPLHREAEVLVMYPPDIQIISGGLTPTTVVQNQWVTFQVDAQNVGSAWAELNTDSYLELTDSSATVYLTTSLASPVMLPADATVHTLIFNPLHFASTPTGTLQANLYLHHMDENGVSDKEVFPGVGPVTVDGWHTFLTITSNPAPTGTSQVLHLGVMNTGNEPKSTHLFSDYVEMTAAKDWGSFTPIGSNNTVCGGTSLWVSDTLSLSPSTVTARWMIESPICGDPYNWAIQTPPATFDVRATTPITPGVYTVTVGTSLNNGNTLTEEKFPFQVGP